MKLEKRNAFLLGIAAYALLITALLLARPGGDGFLDYNIYINVATVLVPIAFGIFATRQFGLKSFQGKSVALLTAACVVWLAADLLWTYFELAVVSMADAFYLAGYPIILVAIFFGIKTINPDFEKERKKMALIVLIAVVLSTLYMMTFPFSWDPGIPFIENFLVTCYAIADLFLLIPSIFLMSQAVSGFFGRPWIAIVAANVFNIIGDTWYNANFGTYAAGDIVDLTWYFAYLLYGAAFVMLVYDSRKAVAGAMEAVAAAKETETAKSTPAAKKKH